MKGRGSEQAGLDMLSVPTRLSEGKVKRSYVYRVNLDYGNDSNAEPQTESYEITLRSQIKPKEGQSAPEALLELLKEEGALSSIRLVSRSEALKKRKEPVADGRISLSAKVAEAERLREESAEGDPMGGLTTPGCSISESKGRGKPRG